MMANELKYELVIYWSREDDCYVVVVPELPGCLADGKTYATGSTTCIIMAGTNDVLQGRSAGAPPTCSR